MALQTGHGQVITETDMSKMLLQLDIVHYDGEVYGEEYILF